MNTNKEVLRSILQVYKHGQGGEPFDCNHHMITLEALLRKFGLFSNNYHGDNLFDYAYKLIELLPDEFSELENVDKMSKSLDEVIEQLQKSTKLLKTIDICKVLVEAGCVWNKSEDIDTIIAEEFYAHTLFNSIGGTYYISEPSVEKFVKAVNNRIGIIRTSEELMNKVRDLGLFKKGSKRFRFV